MTISNIYQFAVLIETQPSISYQNDV